jgi:hypothetical protein
VVRSFEMGDVEERIDRLEQLIADFVTNVGIEFNKLYNSQMRTEAELREFKGEMKVFKDEMREYKEENRRQIKEMNLKWGELANKLGTLAEDLVAPSLPRIAREVLGLEVSDLIPRWKRKLPGGRSKEYDAIGIADEVVFLNSTKSTVKSADVDKLVREIDEFREFFPEYADYKIVGIIASLAVDESIVNYAEKMGFLVLAVGEQLMEVQNSPEFKPKFW